MIHIIDGIPYKENPLLSAHTSEALIEGEHVQVIDDDGVECYNGCSRQYFDELLESLKGFEIHLDDEARKEIELASREIYEGDNIVYLDDYRK